MGILQGYDIIPGDLLAESPGLARTAKTHFLNLTSATRSRPPLTLSAKKTLPVVAIATICECSLKSLKEMGS